MLKNDDFKVIAIAKKHNTNKLLYVEEKKLMLNNASDDCAIIVAPISITSKHHVASNEQNIIENKYDWAICPNNLFVVVFNDNTMVTSFRSIPANRYYGGSVKNILGSNK